MAGIGDCSVQRLGRRLEPVGEKRAQHVLRDFEADASMPPIARRRYASAALRSASRR